MILENITLVWIMLYFNEMHGVGCVISERASVSNVQWKSVIYIFICMYVCIVFSMVRSRACLGITLTQRATNSTFHAGGSSPD